MITHLSRLERQRHWRGQLLASADFRDQLAAEAELAAWHNRALHGAYGIAAGFEGELELGPVIDGTVQISSGLAYDAFGRELRLPAAAELHLPPAGPSPVPAWCLVLRRSGSGGPAEKACSATESSLSEAVELVWLPGRSVSFREGVVLGRLLEGEEGFAWDPDYRPPRARPLARPVIGHGATIPGNTAWQAVPDLAFQGLIRIIEVVVDTSAAGFSEVPCYFAWRVGGHLSVMALTGADAPLPGVLVQLPIPLLDRVTGARTDRFTFSLWAPREFTDPVTGRQITVSRLADLARRQLSVAWIGVQERRRQRDPYR